MGLKDLFLEPFKPIGPLVGIDKGRHSLKIVVINREKGAFELEDFLVEDLSGIEESGRLSHSKQVLSKFLEQRNIFQGEAFVFIGEEDVFSARLTMPQMPADELRKAILWEIKDTLPFPLEEAVVDFQVIEEKQNQDGTTSVDLIFAAVRTRDVKEAASVFNGTGLSVKGVTVVLGALINVVRSSSRIGDGKPVAFLEIGHQHANICVFSKNKLIFARSLSTGIDDIASAMVGTISSPKGVINLSYDDAKRIIEEHGLPVEDRLVGIAEASLDSGRIVSMMRPALEALVDDIQKSFTYVSEKFNQDNISKLYLIGGGSQLKNIDKFLKDQLGVETGILKIEDVIALGTNINKNKIDELPHIITTVGAMISEEEGINFLPYEFRKRKWHVIERISFRMTAFTIISILLLSYSFVCLRYADYKRRYKIMQLYADSLRELRASKAEIDKVDSVVASIKQSSYDATIVLREISAKTPKNVLLEKLDYNSTDGSLKLKGIIRANEAVATAVMSEYIKAIENSLLFEKANLLVSQSNNQTETSYLTFEIEFKMEAKAR